MSRPSTEILELFKHDLWKDQRELDRVTEDGNDRLVKHFENADEAQREAGIINHVQQLGYNVNVPRVYDVQEARISFEYIYGIRLFNLLVALDKLPAHLGGKIATVRKTLIERADQNQAQLQGALMTWPGASGGEKYDVVLKISNTIRILANALDISVDWDKMEKDVALIADIWGKGATVPFRDATTKNMVVASRGLWLGDFDSEDDRDAYIGESLSSDDLPSWVYADLVDFDFSSCLELTSPEDDFISLHFHERTWSRPPRKGDRMRWLPGPVSSEQVAASFIIRFFRFGGRKLAYRLLHPWGHRVRFRHDNGVFYFQRLPLILEEFWDDARSRIPSLLGFINAVARLGSRRAADIDHFMSAGLAEKRVYYVDMYPE